MDVFQFIASLVGSIAWPMAIAIVALVFRNPLQELLPRLKNLKVLGGEAEFTEKLKEAEKSGKEILLQIDQTIPNTRLVNVKRNLAIAKKEAEKKAKDVFFELANNYPEAAVMDSFKMVEESLNALSVELDFPNRTPNRVIIQILADEGFLPTRAVEFYISIAGTRNAAVHATGRTITTGEAIAYRELCVQLLELIREALDRRRKVKREVINLKGKKSPVRENP